MPALPPVSPVPKHLPEASLMMTMICLLQQKSRGIHARKDFIMRTNSAATFLLTAGAVLFHLSSCSVASSHSQNKPQRVALLFEDEDDEYSGSLFGIKPAVNTSTAAPPANVSLSLFLGGLPPVRFKVRYLSH